MKTIYDQTTLTELNNRISRFTESDKAQWGKMSPYQVLKHCTMSEEIFQGKRIYKRMFVGRLFGAMALRGIIKDEKPMKQNLPTHPDMKIRGVGDFAAEQKKWKQLLSDYAGFNPTGFVHPFFGKMSKEQIGRYAYKHADHHLRQFGV